MTAFTSPQRPTDQELAAIIGRYWAQGCNIAESVAPKTWGAERRALDWAKWVISRSQGSFVETICDEIIRAHPTRAAEAKAKPILIGWFVGKVMQALNGNADPSHLTAILDVKLGITATAGKTQENDADYGKDMDPPRGRYQDQWPGQMDQNGKPRGDF